MIQTTDKVILEFPVLWEGCDCDSVAWIMERQDGTRYLKMTIHGRKYEASIEELQDRLKEYELVTRKTREALSLLLDTLGR